MWRILPRTIRTISTIRTIRKNAEEDKKCTRGSDPLVHFLSLPRFFSRIFQGFSGAGTGEIWYNIRNTYNLSGKESPGG